jgi:thiol-disulfide isomerase/thioredoxin
MRHGKKSDEHFKSSTKHYLRFIRCKFSKRFVDIWEELAENYRKDKRILFADMDCVAEKVCYDVYGVSKYPSLYIFWNNERFGEKYTGYRNVPDLTDFIEEAIRNITSTY